jgi:hypothetical protein
MLDIAARRAKQSAVGGTLQAAWIIARAGAGHRLPGRAKQRHSVNLLEGGSLQKLKPG